MKTEKRGTQIKKKYSKDILYQLESIVKTLYPSKKTGNPYQDYLKVYYQELPIADVLLFKRLLHAITVLNHKERMQTNKRYQSTYGDVLTAIELLSAHTIEDVILQSYVTLKTAYRDQPFTKLQASLVLRKSMRTVERYLQLLKHLHLVENTGIKQGSRHTYRLLGYTMANEDA